MAATVENKFLTKEIKTLLDRKFPIFQSGIYRDTTMEANPDTARAIGAPASGRDPQKNQWGDGNLQDSNARTWTASYIISRKICK